MPSIPNPKSETHGLTATKTCSKCGAEKPLTEFNKKADCKGGFDTQCKVCKREFNAAWSNQKPDASYLHYIASKRAKKRGTEFTISIEDVEAVDSDVCPYLGIDIKRYPNTAGGGRVGGASQRPDAKSLDRIDSAKGYVPGNIIVCSWRANKLLSDATAAEMALIAMNFHRILNETTNPTD